MYEIMDPIWILEIKTSDLVQGGSCSHLERQSKKAWTGKRREKKMENLQRKKLEYIVTRSRTISCKSIRHRSGSERAAILFSHYIQARVSLLCIYIFVNSP